MLTMFNRKKTFKYSEEQVKAIAAEISKLMAQVADARAETVRSITNFSEVVKMLCRIRDCYPHVFSECVSQEEIKQLMENL
jgi:formylmethanofuran dehydrogenase subunit E-like metal-binding protein